MSVANIFQDKKVLVTGHTGFKGSWLVNWLLKLGAEVTGYSAYLPSNPCNFALSNLEGKIKHIEGDVRDFDSLRLAFLNQPEIVFHLAAQPLVRRSYDNPAETFSTNIQGTVNLLECVRLSPGVRAVILITSDKCYANQEWLWGYRENDRLGGEDPYSASKACAELVSNSYIKSFFASGCAVATVRAGNVIGGGDWAADRIIPDCIRSWTKDETVIVRSPQATRPWQHVLEPLSGYLALAENLLNGDKPLRGESFNFGPAGGANRSVAELIETFLQFWGAGEWKIVTSNDKHKKESSLLQLNCDKARTLLGWEPVLNFRQCLEFTCAWYQNYYKENGNMYDFTSSQIDKYTQLATQKTIKWAVE